MQPSALIAALLCILGLASPVLSQHARAAPPVLELPIACSIPDQCFVAFYVDRAAGSEIGDYRCSNRTYDTHRGTDFRVRSPADFAAGIPVLAAAAGTVIATRDDMQDIDVVELGRDKVAGRASGNTIYLQHDDGWVSQYWHLRRGTLTVRKGDRVMAGQKLGLVGLSGDTSFPHLHFELRRGASDVIDPFSGEAPDAACNATGKPEKSMWSTKAAAILSYRYTDATGGFAAQNPTRNDAVYGRLGAAPKAGPGRLVFWFELFGVKRDDLVAVQFVLPDGAKRAPSQMRVDGATSQIFRFVPLNVETLPPGSYGAILTLRRNGEAAPVFERRFDIDVK